MIPLGAKRPEDYDEYHKHCIFDAVIPSVRNDVIRDCFNDDGKQTALLLFATARPDRHNFRELTESWIGKALGGIQYELLMRPAASTAPSAVVKMQALNAVFEGRHECAIYGWQRVIQAFDDRQDILDTYPISASQRSLRMVEVASGEGILTNGIAAAVSILQKAEKMNDWGDVQDAATTLEAAVKNYRQHAERAKG